jgi:hypothetical protein
MTSNRAILLVDEGCFQPDLACAGRIIPVAGVVGSRDPGASPPTRCAAAEGADETGIPEHRPAHFLGALLCGAEHVERPHHRESGDGDPLASCGLSSLVALEIKVARRPAADAR